MALLRPLHSEGAVAQAVRYWQQGHLVGMPTETVYGLAAHAEDPVAIARVYAAKGRPSDHPLIVHVAAGNGPHDPCGWRTAVEHFAHPIPDFAWALMSHFWPGPLTLLLPRRPLIGAAAAAGHPTIGLRCPDHAGAQTLLQAARDQGLWGIAAPSANRFGRVSPTSAAHVAHEFAHTLNDDDLLILDDGPCSVGIESTIIDASRHSPVLLRPGMIPLFTLAEVAEQPITMADAQAPKASGTLASHYSPRARVMLLRAEHIGAWLQTSLAATPHHARATVDLSSVALYVSTSTQQHLGALAREVGHYQSMPEQATECATELFAVLRQLDMPHITTIVVQQPPLDAAWDGVRDRLQRAAA